MTILTPLCWEALLFPPETLQNVKRVVVLCLQLAVCRLTMIGVGLEMHGN